MDGSSLHGTKIYELMLSLMPNGLKIFFWLKADYKRFDQDLSYVPNTELGLYGSYHYNEQWYLSGSIRYIGERNAIRHLISLTIILKH